jgi:hypothetical protein
VTHESESIGLCASCAHVQVVTSARGSTFFLCKLSLVDSRFAKYPVLPVRQCVGYEFDAKNATR